MKKVGGLLVLWALLSACHEEVKENQVKRYFDLKGLVEKQINSLNSQKSTVRKVVLLSEKTETQTIKNIDWARELTLFTQADLNKPAFIQSYSVDSSSNGVKYTLKNTEKLPVKYLTVSRVGEDGIRVEALMNSKNYLYEIERYLEMNLKNNNVTSYQIKGFQKIIFGNKKVFNINGVIEP